MRRPHVYERSVPRARRDAHEMPDGHPAQTARAILRSLPAVIAAATAAGFTELAALLDAARAEADRIDTGAPPPAA